MIAVATLLAAFAVAQPPTAYALAAAPGIAGPSPYYDLKVMAQVPDAGLQSIGDGVSLNDAGTVAFTGVLGGDGLCVTDGTTAPTNVAAALLQPRAASARRGTVPGP